jgi:hypothetical protein
MTPAGLRVMVGGFRRQTPDEYVVSVLGVKADEGGRGSPSAYNPERTFLTDAKIIW